VREVHRDLLAVEPLEGWLCILGGAWGYPSGPLARPGTERGDGGRLPETRDGGSTGSPPSGHLGEPESEPVAQTHVSTTR
jgi:hypothetical protein